MGEIVDPPSRDPFAFDDLQRALWHRRDAVSAAARGIVKLHSCANPVQRCDNLRPTGSDGRSTNARRTPTHNRTLPPLATELELSEFLKGVEKRAFKRCVYHVRNEESALDIVQESMMKLAEHYGDKPAAELPLLFQRILSNCTLDWFRRQKTRRALFSNFSDYGCAGEDENFDILETLELENDSEGTESAEDTTSRAQVLRAIEAELQQLSPRQREAFLLRYWEEMDVSETAAAMGCSEGSVKVHCFRATQALSTALKAKGMKI